MTEQEYSELHKRLRKADDASHEIWQMRAILDGPGLPGVTRIAVPIQPLEGSCGPSTTSMEFTAGQLWPFIRKEAERRLELAIHELAEV